jgi:putative transposase
MKRRRHTPEQIIRKLREADRLLAEGQEVPEVAKQLESARRPITDGGPSTGG